MLSFCMEWLKKTIKINLFYTEMNKNKRKIYFLEKVCSVWILTSCRKFLYLSSNHKIFI